MTSALKQRALTFAVWLNQLSLVSLTAWYLGLVRPPLIPDLYVLALVVFTFATTSFVVWELVTRGIISDLATRFVNHLAASCRFVSNHIRSINLRLVAFVALFWGLAVALSEVGMAPPLDTWLSGDTTVLAFFAKYVAVIVALILAVVLLGIVFRASRKVMSRPSPEAELLFGKSLGQLVFLALFLTGFAQVVSCWVSFAGIEFLLFPRLGDTLYVNVALPLLGIDADKFRFMPMVWTIQVTGSEFVAGLMAVLISLAVWTASAFAILSLMLGQRPTLTTIVVLVSFALTSFTSGMVFYIAPDAIVRTLVVFTGDVRSDVRAVRVEDRAMIEPITARASGLRDKASADLSAEIVQLLGDEFEAIHERTSSELSLIALLSAKAATYRSYQKSYFELHKQELEEGLFTDEAGDGRVAQSLLTVSVEYGLVTDQFDSLHATSVDLIADIDRLKADFGTGLASGDAQLARETLDNLNTILTLVSGLSPASALEGLAAILGGNLLQGEESSKAGLRQKQRDALERVNSDLQKQRAAVVAELDALKQERATFDDAPRPTRVLPQNVRLDLRREIIGLDGLLGVLSDIRTSRAAALDDIAVNLEKAEQDARELLTSRKIISQADKVGNDIKDQIEHLEELSSLNLTPVLSRINTLDFSKDELNSVAETLVPNYPDTRSYTSPSPLEAVAAQWQIGILHGLVQLLVDLGFTFGFVKIIGSLPVRTPLREGKIGSKPTLPQVKPAHQMPPPTGRCRTDDPIHLE